MRKGRVAGERVSTGKQLSRKVLDAQKLEDLNSDPQHPPEN